MSDPISGDPLLRDPCATFDGCLRWAVDVSVIDGAHRGLFDEVWERDAPGGPP